MRLRYAALLFEETENEDTVQEILTKGIALCERNRLTDLKYSMHHLLIRLNFQGSPRAALRSIDKLLPDLEAYQQTSWIYAFRFLRISLSLQIPEHTEYQAALQHLHSITELAEKHRHVAVAVTAAAFEALIHLRSHAADFIEQTQRALATARTHQLDPEMNQVPQLLLLVDCLDLACALANHSTSSIGAKMQAIQNAMDVHGNDLKRQEDGTFCLPFGGAANPDLELDSGGVFKITSTGHQSLAFRWLQYTQLYTLAYLLSGISTMHKVAADERAAKYLIEGVKITKGKRIAVDLLGAGTD